MASTFDSLMQALRKSGKVYEEDKIAMAYRLAEKAHGGQQRQSGEPYISHPLAVAEILVGLGMDSDCICAALLHDVVEDTDITLEVLQKKFGHDVALMVDGVTKIKKLSFASKEDKQSENIRKMLLAMSEDIRVIIIKLADRLHNIRTLQFKSPEKQRLIALETMEIYAPIAHRLGIRGIKEELEDRSLFYLDPVGYHEIEEQLELKKADREQFIEEIKARIARRLKDFGVEPHIEGRVKSIYGIYRKVYMMGKSFEELYDIYAVRIIVNTVIECYNILGIIHDLFQPIPNRFKDYISTPKPNMYQSLHTTVIDKEGIPFEIQIRTWDMHYTAEFGIAAHWKYKAGIQGKDRLEERLAWVRQIIENQQEAEGAEDIVKNIKTDLAVDDVFVFTPKGDVKCLPAGSTIVDFAYAIHTAVGNRMVGAKVDGRMVPLDYQVKTGQIVEILTSKSDGAPNRNWLSIAKTSEARNKIRAWFKKERKEENIAEGKAEFERELRRNLIHLEGEDYQKFLDSLVKRYHRESADDFFAAIGYGGLPLSRMTSQIKDEYTRLQKEKTPEQPAAVVTAPRKSSSGVIVEGIDNCLVKFAQCCNPLPGDDIIGFVTRGYGVSVHKRDCVNVQNADPAQQDRWINVHWADNRISSFRSTLDIVAKSDASVLAEISLAFANMRVPVHEFNARELKNGNRNILATISTQGLEHLSNIIQKLNKVPGVLSVERSGK
ncbi:MAG TPA: bifunctional (p)ppGpp synthetase/guanosine-3',5'-bis(diphosphate) 3'-pyrophosphohydrolase [Candidatus Merdivicinus excrementipullorum]|uniref:GTP diphosphokinase n=1 Tax=Candidatus Merdivicinus excrementipullorum TaxID=2840867 RepID=A0A9D1FPT7_9FIRM|nr:bifunctional (p)ppGpp synthetase/guanosine-3',5'-bis(diphosphate) 3'-pyrophosphohydrolase [Candidatus Merdivicinus excrementipullorum]